MLNKLFYFIETDQDFQIGRNLLLYKNTKNINNLLFYNLYLVWTSRGIHNEIKYVRRFHSVLYTYIWAGLKRAKYSLVWTPQCATVSSEQCRVH